jgi:hypothetical protein
VGVFDILILNSITQIFCQHFHLHLVYKHSKVLRTTRCLILIHFIVLIISLTLVLFPTRNFIHIRSIDEQNSKCDPIIALYMITLFMSLICVPSVQDDIFSLLLFCKQIEHSHASSCIFIHIASFSNDKFYKKK